MIGSRSSASSRSSRRRRRRRSSARSTRSSRADYIINSGGSFGGHRPQPDARRADRRSCPRSRRSRRCASATAEHQRQRRLHHRGRPGDRRSSCSTSTGRGHARRPRDRRHRGVEEEGRRPTTGRSATAIPVTFVKTGSDPLQVEIHLQRKQIVLPATTSSRSQTLREELHRAARLLDLRQAEARRVAPSRAAARSSRCSTAYPTAKLQDNAQYKADQKKSSTRSLGLVYVLLFLAVIIAFIGIANTLRCRSTNARARSGCCARSAMSRRQVRSMIRWESVIIALLGTVLGLVIGAVLRLGVVDGAARPGHHEVRSRARAARRHRRVRRGLAASSPRSSRRAARRSSTCCSAISTRVTRTATSDEKRSCTRGVLVAHLLARGRPGSAPSRRAASRRSVARMRTASRPAFWRCRPRPSRPGCRPASARSTAASRGRRAAASGTGTPITGSGVIDAVMPGQVRGAAGAGDDHPQAPVGGRCGRTRTSRRACGAPRRCAPRAHAELGEHVDRGLHRPADRSRCP